MGPNNWSIRSMSLITEQELAFKDLNSNLVLFPLYLRPVSISIPSLKICQIVLKNAVIYGECMRAMLCWKMMEGNSCSVVSNSLQPRELQSTTPLSMELSRQEYWSGFVISCSRDLTNPGIKPISPVSRAGTGRFFITEPPGKPKMVKTRS